MEIAEIMIDRYKNVSDENAIICFALRYFQAIETEIQKWATFLTHRLLHASSGFIPRLGKVSSHCEWRFMDAERVSLVLIFNCN